jgi:hypothetical protein
VPKYTNYQHSDNRNYDAEARQLIKPLTRSQCHDLYEQLVIKLQRTPQGSVKEQEILAVKRAIETRKDVDQVTLHKLRQGYGSMAHDARAKDGNTEKHRKRV